MAQTDSIHPPEYNAVWLRRGLTIAGTGGHRTHDPGTGRRRYAEALEFLRDSGAEIGFASFTFDPAEPGSVVIVPDEVIDRFSRRPAAYTTGSIEDDDSERWPKMVREALIEIDRGQVEKVVLARRVRATFAEEIDIFSIAARLVLTQPDSNVFAIAGLVGASPELLLRIKDGMVSSTPLAGSSTDRRSDLETAKNAREHLLAADSVDEALARVGIDYQRHQPEIVEAGDLRHLGTRFEGIAPDGVGFADILGHLHPTAAVAGTPTSDALAIIREMEEVPRGRYSGPVGWFDSKGQGEFAVAIRCGTIEGRTATLHSGAGIVAGSSPDDELEETRWKLQPMLEALGISER